jgi:hypothetical protein
MPCKQNSDKILMVRLQDQKYGWEIVLADSKDGRALDVLDTIYFYELAGTEKSFAQVVDKRVKAAQRRLRVREFARKLKELQERDGVA